MSELDQCDDRMHSADNKLDEVLTSDISFELAGSPLHIGQNV